MASIKFNRRKKIAKFAALIILPILVLGYLYYLELSRYDKGIIPPLKTQIPFVSETFNADSGFVFHRSSGTHIEIPAGALVTENGDPVSGEVELKYREFYNAGDIFLSGIPMQLGDDRQKYMSSGGMMELRVFQGDKELQLADDTEVQVDLAASFTAEDDYKMYFLTDEVEWDNGSAFERVNNDRRDSAIANLPEIPLKPANPDPDSSQFVFEIAADLKKLPQLRAWKGVQWRLIENKSKLATAQALSINWNKTAIKQTDAKNNTYTITFSSMKKTYEGNIIKETCVLTASPLLSGRALAKARDQYEEDLSAYAAITANVEAAEERLLMESSLLNRFRIEGFGIFNIDIIYNMEVLATVTLSFDFQEEFNPYFNKTMLFMLLEDRNGLLRYNAFDWDEIPVVDYECTLVVVLPNGDVAYVSKEDFKRQINENTVNSYTNKTFYFKTERSDYESFSKELKPTSTPKFI